MREKVSLVRGGGKWVEEGEYPDDIDTLGKITENICYYNAKNYFGF